MSSSGNIEQSTFHRERREEKEDEQQGKLTSPDSDLPLCIRYFISGEKKVAWGILFPNARFSFLLYEWLWADL